MLIAYFIAASISTAGEIKIQNKYPRTRTLLEKGDLEKIDTTTLKDTFALAELAYFNSKFNYALNLYRSIPTASKDCNDAFLRIQIIKENTPENLQDYVTAELLYRKGKTEESLKILKKLKKSHSNISMYAHILILNLVESQKKYELIIKEGKEFMSKFPDASQTPVIMMKMGNAYEKLGNKKDARQIYNEILLKYPKSPASQLARFELEK